MRSSSGGRPDGEEGASWVVTGGSEWEIREGDAEGDDDALGDVGFDETITAPDVGVDAEGVEAGVVRSRTAGTLERMVRVRRKVCILRVPVDRRSDWGAIGGGDGGEKGLEKKWSLARNEKGAMAQRSW